MCSCEKSILQRYVIRASHKAQATCVRSPRLASLLQERQAALLVKTLQDNLKLCCAKPWNEYSPWFKSLEVCAWAVKWKKHEKDYTSTSSCGGTAGMGMYLKELRSPTQKNTNSCPGGCICTSFVFNRCLCSRINKTWLWTTTTTLIGWPASTTMLPATRSWVI